MSSFTDPTILYQYSGTERLRALLDNIKEFARNNSKATLCDFFDLDIAIGNWLDQLGGFLNISRPFVSVDNTFIMDQSLMDSTDLMDGTAPASDSIYRSFIKSRIARRNSRFTIEDIIAALQFIIGARNIFITEGVKMLDIFISVTSEEQERVANILTGLDRKWFGLPSGVGLGQFEIYVIPDGGSFFLMDSSPMDDSTFLMV